MRIIVFGATGATGRQVVEAALAEGYEVVAFVRDPAKVQRSDPRLRVVQGDLTDAQAVITALDGVDGVISAAGHVAGTPPDLLAGLVDALVEGLDGRSVRVVSLLGAGIDWPGDPPPSLGRRFMTGAMRLFAGAMLRDAQVHGDRLRASGLPFVIARPPRLTDGPATGRVTAAPYLPMGFSKTVSRADLARFLVDQLRDDRFLGAAPMLHRAP